MTSAVNQTPIDVRPRRMDFPFGEVKQHYFFDNNLLKSAYMAALSTTFPAGEGEFIESVRLFRDQVDDPELQEQIRGFIGQEGHHSHQHKAFNKALSDLGFDALRLEKIFEKELASNIRGRTPAQRLAFTVCFEHHTAILADAFLTNEFLFKGMNPMIADLLRWHAVEEIEHKSVAFDLYMATVGDRALLKKVQRIATMLFTYRINKYVVKLCWWAGKVPSLRDIKGYYDFMYGKNGLRASIKADYLDFFRDDFHPWDIQNQHLIDDWREQYYKPEYDRGSEVFEQKQGAA